MNIVLYYKLFKINELIEIIKTKPPHIELVLTRGYAPQKLIEMTDLTTEMNEVKHYYIKGIEVRKGIEY